MQGIFEPDLATIQSQFSRIIQSEDIYAQESEFELNASQLLRKTHYNQLIIQLREASSACVLPTVKDLATAQLPWINDLDLTAIGVGKQKTAIAFLATLVAFTEDPNTTNYSELHKLYPKVRLDPKDLEAIQQDLTVSRRLACEILGPQHSGRINSSTLKFNGDGSISGTIKLNRGSSTSHRIRVAETLTHIGLYKIQGANGYKTNKNEGIADLIRAATEDNAPSAMYNLGVAFEKGYTDDGIPNLHLALNYYTQAAEADPRDKMAKQKIALMRRMIAAVSDDGLEVDLGQASLSFSV